MQTQTSNTLHNAITEAGGKDRLPMLAPSNYVQWKSKIKRYIDTKPNHELIHYCLKNPPYKYTWADKVILVSEGSSETTTETYMVNYKNVSQDIHDQLNAEAEAVQISLTGIDNDIYSTVDSCPNACEMWKAIERAERIARTANPLAIVAQQQLVYHPQNHPTYYTQNSSTRSQLATTRNRGKAIINSRTPIYDQEPSMVAEDDEMSKDKEIDKLMALISLSFKKIYKPTNNNLRTSSNTSRANQDNSPRINRGAGYQRECQKPKRAKDAAYHREMMLLYKQEEAGIQLNVEQADWRDDTDDESEDQELEAHYMYMAQIQEFSVDAADSGPIFDSKPLQKVSNDDHYNVFAIESEHLEQSKSIHDTYSIEQDEHNVIIDSLDMSYDREHIDHDDDDGDISNERELLASLIEKLQCEIDDSKNRNKFLETSNKVLVEKLKGEIEDFKTKNKSLESSNNRFKEVNNKLLETNALMYNDLKKFQAELDRRNDVEYASKINDLNQMISEMKKELSAHQETISILSQAKEAQIKRYKTREDKELDKVIALENKVKILDNIVYKTDEVTNLQCDYLETLDKCECLGKKLSKRVILTTSVSRPQLKRNQKEDRVMLNNSQGKKQEVEDHSRNVKFSKNKTSVTACNDSLKAKTSNVNFVCATCGKYVLNVKNDMCVLKSLNGMNSRTKMPIVVPISTREPKRIIKQSVVKPFRRTLVEIILFIVDSGCSKQMTGNLKLLINFIEKFLGTMKFGNDQIAPILGYGDLVQGAATIKMVYYVKGLNHNLFSIGQFCDADLEVAFRKSTCYIRDLKGNDLLTGSRRTDLYSITLQDITSPNPICLMAKATSSQAWLWHR
nr:integrase, catalytic region, zinc finger, CCHC-type, peptidase aspartic, catalytic [Tanacetum cinerariifolium]